MAEPGDERAAGGGRHGGERADPVSPVRGEGDASVRQEAAQMTPVVSRGQDPGDTQPSLSVARDTQTTRERAILEWLASGDTGISSATLALASVGIENGRWGAWAPVDEGDSGRCEWLATRCPFVTEALPGLIARNPEWERWAPRIRKAAGHV